MGAERPLKTFDSSRLRNLRSWSNSISTNEGIMREVKCENPMNRSTGQKQDRLTLKSNHFCMVENFFDKDLLIALKLKINRIIKEKPTAILGRSYKLSLLSNDELKLKGAAQESRPNNDKKLVGEKEFNKGEPNISNLTNACSIVDPFLNFPELIKLALDFRLLEIVKSYLGETPYLTFAKIRKHYVNQLPNFDTNFFHYDDNVPENQNFLKVFIPLQESKKREDGQFMFIPKSAAKIKQIISDYGDLLINEEQLSDYYPTGSIYAPKIELGDIFMLDTVKCLHKGTKPESTERILITFNYSSTAEFDQVKSTLKINRKDLLRLDDDQKQWCKLLDIKE